MVDLDDVHGSSGGGDGDTETEQESTSHELTSAIGSCLDAGTDDNDGCTDEHADSATPGVEGGTDEGKSHNTTNLVHGRDNTSPNTVVLGAITLLERRVLKQVVDQGTVITVHGGTEETDEREGVDHQLGFGPGIRRFLDHGLVECLATPDDLGLDFLLQHHDMLAAAF